MPAALSVTVFTQRNFVADFLQAKEIIGKRVVHLLVVLIKPAKKFT